MTQTQTTLFFIITAIMLFGSIMFSQTALAAPTDKSRPFDQYTWLTTHNAFVNADGGWDITVSNQGVKSIQEQLDEGVRGIMLDAHWHDESVELCHGDDGACDENILAGVRYSIPRTYVDQAMGVIVIFLNNNPEEIVTVFIEDHTSGTQLMDVLDASWITDLTFLLNEDDLKTYDWPTYQWLLDNNHRLLIMTDDSNNGNDFTNPAGGGPLYYDRNIIIESMYGDGDSSKCDPRYDYNNDSVKNGTDLNTVVTTGLPPANYWNKLLLVNHFSTVGNYIQAENNNDYSDLGSKINNVCIPAADQYPNYIAVDYFYASRDDIDQVLDEAEQDWADKWVGQTSTNPPSKCALPPSSGDWIITKDCTVSVDATINNGNLLVQNNSVFTIGNNSTVDVDFVNNSINVELGSGILVNVGSKIH